MGDVGNVGVGEAGLQAGLSGAELMAMLQACQAVFRMAWPGAGMKALHSASPGRQLP